MPNYEKPRDFFWGKVIPLYVECVGERLNYKEALLLQQLHYWLKANEQNLDHIWDGHVWVWNSLGEWAKAVPVGGEKTISRLFDHLVETGLVLESQHGGQDRRKSYTIVYAEAEKLSSGQSVHMDKLSIWTECPDDKDILSASSGQLVGLQSDNLSACNKEREYSKKSQRERGGLLRFESGFEDA